MCHKGHVLLFDLSRAVYHVIFYSDWEDMVELSLCGLLEVLNHTTFLVDGELCIRELISQNCQNLLGADLGLGM